MQKEEDEHNFPKMGEYLKTDTKVCIEDHIKEIIESFEENEDDDAFFVGNLEDILQKQKLWKTCLPRVEPFYAVKCNDLHPVLKVMADNDMSFDCASKTEIQKVLDLGVDPSKIVFANSCKQKSFIKYAIQRGVDLMTFDSEEELVKMHSICRNARLILRFNPLTNYKDDYNLCEKFGCRLDEVEHLLQIAQNLKLNVVGVSFHVGSLCKNIESYRHAIAQAHDIFKIGLNFGIKMDILDIGGGFPGEQSSDIQFEEMAEVINKSLDRYFPEEDVRIIAEPGRFYVASAFTIVTNVIAKRVVTNKIKNRECQRTIMYYLNDGLYGSFECARNENIHITPLPIKDYELTKLYNSSIWGPTCDGLDCIIKYCKLPELSQGDWIYFKDMGAYSFTLASNFNGMPRPRPFYVFNGHLWKGETESCENRDRSGCSLPVPLLHKSNHGIK